MQSRLNIKESISKGEVILSSAGLSVGYFFEWIKSFWPLILCVSSLMLTFALLYYLRNPQTRKKLKKPAKKQKGASLVALVKMRLVAYPFAVICISVACPLVSYLYHYSEIQERKRMSLEAMATQSCIDTFLKDADGLKRISDDYTVTVDGVTLTPSGRETVLSVNYLSTGKYEKAYAGLEKATRENDATAMYYLGIALRFGIGCEPDPIRALYYLEEAAKRESIMAQIEMAKSYMLKMGTRFDAEKVEYWYKRAISNNFDHRTNLYAMSAYMNLMGWYLATEQGDKCYEACENFPRSLKRDRVAEMLQEYRILACWKTGRFNKALRIARRGVRKNYPVCFCKLGFIYENGIAVDKNLAEAERLYLYAAQHLNYSSAYDDLIRLYQDNGQPEEAEFWTKVKNSGIQ